MSHGFNVKEDIEMYGEYEKHMKEKAYIEQFDDADLLKQFARHQKYKINKAEEKMKIIQDILDRFNFKILDEYPKAYYIEAIKEIKQLTES